MPDQVRSTVDDFERLIDDPEEPAGDDGDEEGVEGGEQDTSDDVEGDADESGDDDEQQAQASDEPKYRVKVDGRVEEVPLTELVNGYQRAADYTRKTQQLAETRKNFESEAAAVRAERERYQQVLQTLEQRLRAASPEPNWDQLRATDPVGFAAAWADHQRKNAEISALQAEQQRVSQMHALEEQQRMAEFAQSEHERLLDALPKWRDPKVAKAERQAVVDYGLSIGFTADELSQVIDHRAVVVLNKARLYDQIAARKGQIRQQVEQAPVKATAVRAGTGARKPGGEVKTLKNRLAQTGRVRDAAALFERMDL